MIIATPCTPIAFEAYRVLHIELDGTLDVVGPTRRELDCLVNLKKERFEYVFTHSSAHGFE